MPHVDGVVVQNPSFNEAADAKEWYCDSTLNYSVESVSISVSMKIYMPKAYSSCTLLIYTTHANVVHIKLPNLPSSVREFIAQSWHLGHIPEFISALCYI